MLLQKIVVHIFPIQNGGTGVPLQHLILCVYMATRHSCTKMSSHGYVFSNHLMQNWLNCSNVEKTIFPTIPWYLACRRLPHSTQPEDFFFYFRSFFFYFLSGEGAIEHLCQFQEKWWYSGLNSPKKNVCVTI